MILKKLKEQDKKVIEKIGKSKQILENSEKITKKRDNKQKLNNMFKEAAEIKYSIDNLFNKRGDNKETFSAENYRLCLDCNTIVEKKAMNCPYCGSNLS